MKRHLKMRQWISTILSWIAAMIMAQTLWFKFTAAEESVYIFSSLGMEPWGRIGAGITELIAALLLVVPMSRHLGALIAMGLMLGAILFHLTVVDIVIMGDGGLLFYLAILTFICSMVVFILEYKSFISLKRFLFGGSG